MGTVRRAEEEVAGRGLQSNSRAWSGGVVGMVSDRREPDESTVSVMAIRVLAAIFIVAGTIYFVS